MDTTKSRTKTIVRISPERQIHIAEDQAEFIRRNAIDRVQMTFDRAQNVWGSLEGLTNAGDLTTEQREQIGALYWLLGDMRETLGDLLYLTEHAAANYVESNVLGKPVGQEFDTAR